jgi:hypothetical protein
MTGARTFTKLGPDPRSQNSRTKPGVEAVQPVPAFQAVLNAWDPQLNASMVYESGLRAAKTVLIQVDRACI